MTNGGTTGSSKWRQNTAARFWRLKGLDLWYEGDSRGGHHLPIFYTMSAWAVITQRQRTLPSAKPLWAWEAEAMQSQHALSPTHKMACYDAAQSTMTDDDVLTYTFQYFTTTLLKLCKPEAALWRCFLSLILWANFACRYLCMSGHLRRKVSSSQADVHAGGLTRVWPVLKQIFVPWDLDSYIGGPRNPEAHWCSLSRRLVLKGSCSIISMTPFHWSETTRSKLQCMSSRWTIRSMHSILIPGPALWSILNISLSLLRDDLQMSDRMPAWTNFV